MGWGGRGAILCNSRALCFHWSFSFRLCVLAWHVFCFVVFMLSILLLWRSVFATILVDAFFALLVFCLFLLGWFFVFFVYFDFVFVLLDGYLALGKAIGRSRLVSWKGLWSL